VFIGLFSFLILLIKLIFNYFCIFQIFKTRKIHVNAMYINNIESTSKKKDKSIQRPKITLFAIVMGNCDGTEAWEALSVRVMTDLAVLNSLWTLPVASCVRGSSASPSRSGGMYSRRRTRAGGRARWKRVQRGACNSGNIATAY